jgi:hypothetical protein
LARSEKPCKRYGFYVESIRRTTVGLQVKEPGILLDKEMRYNVIFLSTISMMLPQTIKKTMHG